MTLIGLFFTVALVAGVLLLASEKETTKRGAELFVIRAAVIDCDLSNDLFAHFSVTASNVPSIFCITTGISPANTPSTSFID